MVKIMNEKKASIIGIGNVTMGDEGIGPYVIEALAQEDWPPNITLAETGPRVYDLDVYLYQQDYVILVQAFEGGKPPGYIYRLGYKELKEMCGEVFRFPPLPSCNASGLYMSRLADYVRLLPPEVVTSIGVEPLLPTEVTFIGVEPQIVCLQLGLSKQAIASMRKVIRLIKKDLQQRGFLPATSKVVPLIRYELSLLKTTI